jgi:hypothetical protein
VFGEDEIAIEIELSCDSYQNISLFINLNNISHNLVEVVAAKTNQ